MASASAAPPVQWFGGFRTPRLRTPRLRTPAASRKDWIDHGNLYLLRRRPMARWAASLQNRRIAANTAAEPPKPGRKPPRRLEITPILRNRGIDGPLLSYQVAGVADPIALPNTSSIRQPVFILPGKLRGSRQRRRGQRPHVPRARPWSNDTDKKAAHLPEAFERIDIGKDRHVDHVGTRAISDQLAGSRLDITGPASAFLPAAWPVKANC
jgi:hypothetical protein